ncbi:MAG TPA: hypothetical protein VFU89_08330 [Rhabdochlamydiaceae bacterium]|nr:hypothetical protein [Rhabdochlamydiaceae bacterium]
MPIATKRIKTFLIASCVLGGCYNAPEQPSTKESVVHLITEPSKTPKKQTQEPYHCFFIPPKGWQFADQSKLSHRIKICFLGKTSNNLQPSVNLATEKVNISLKAYIEIVRSDCAKDPNCVWRDLGKYHTPLGEGRLTEREMKTKWGLARQVQLIVIKDNQAYILTAGALKEEFSSHYQDFEAVLKSLTITDDLTSPIMPLEKRALLQSKIKTLEADFDAAMTKAETVEKAFNTVDFQKETWEPFHQMIINDFTEMGPYWQILLLRDIQYQLLKRHS